MYEFLNRIKPTCVLHLPQGHDSDLVTGWTAELRRFIKYLEDNFDVTITDEMFRELAEKLCVPYMSVETDYSQSDSGQLSTRIEAFMEML